MSERTLIVVHPRPTDCGLCGSNTMDNATEHVVSAKEYTGSTRTLWFCNWSCLGEYAARRIRQ